MTFRKGHKINLGKKNAFGHKCSEAAKQKISEALTGKKLSEEHIRNIKEGQRIYFSNGHFSPMKGKHHSEAAKKKIGIKGRGRIPWNKGKKLDKEKYPAVGFFGKHSKASRIKISKAHKGKKLSEKHIDQLKLVAKYGNENSEWKGDLVGYRALHHWVQRILGKATHCSICPKIGTGREIHWANKDHKYRRVKEDYFEACIKCHGKYDKINGLRKYK